MIKMMQKKLIKLIILIINISLNEVKNRIFKNLEKEKERKLSENLMKSSIIKPDMKFTYSKNKTLQITPKMEKFINFLHNFIASFFGKLIFLSVILINVIVLCLETDETPFSFLLILGKINFFFNNSFFH